MNGSQATANREKVVPLVTSDVAGPLGVLHLPRLWTKLTLGAAGKLADDYDECGPGFDQMTLNALNLGRDETMEFVRSAKPTYVQFEQWVLQKNGGKLDPDRVKAHNEAVRGYNHSDDTCSGIHGACGISDTSIRDAVTLNKLDDFNAFHASVTAQ